MKYAAWVALSAALAGCLVLGSAALPGGGDLVLVPGSQAAAADSPAEKPPAKAAALPPLKVDRNAQRLSDQPAPRNKPGGLPPLKVDRGAPLLLDESAPKSRPKPKGPVADNQACFVCHTNYQDEPMAAVHADNNVGCVKCHGESIPHRNDENNTTPPGTMFPPDKIELNCITCHDTHDAPAKKVLALWKERSAKSLVPGEVLCTDCHGEHRLSLRSVRWDKATGRLLTGAKPTTQPAAAGPPPPAK